MPASGRRQDRQRHGPTPHRPHPRRRRPTPLPASRPRQLRRGTGLLLRREQRQEAGSHCRRRRQPQGLAPHVQRSAVSPARSPCGVSAAAARQCHAQLQPGDGPAGSDPGADVHAPRREGGNRRDHLVRRERAAQPECRRGLHRQELESKLPEDNVEDLAEENKGDYTGIIAYYRDQKTGKEKTITAGDQTKPRRLRWLYACEKTAKRAVNREYKRISK